MSTLECRKTFLEVVELSRQPSNRSKSVPVDDQEEESEPDTRADDLLRRVASRFAWQSEWLGISSGSLGHPFLCRAPCIRAVYGTCMKGPRCEFCHLEHVHPKRKLRRQERERLETMRELLALLIFQWHLEQQVIKLKLEQQLRLVLVVVQRHVRCLRQAQVPTELELCRVMENLWILRGFSLGQLFHSLQHWPQVSATFKHEVKFLVDSARQSMVVPSRA